MHTVWRTTVTLKWTSFLKSARSIYPICIFKSTQNVFINNIHNSEHILCRKNTHVSKMIMSKTAGSPTAADPYSLMNEYSILRTYLFCAGDPYCPRQQPLSRPLYYSRIDKHVLFGLAAGITVARQYDVTLGQIRILRVKRRRKFLGFWRIFYVRSMLKKFPKWEPCPNFLSTFHNFFPQKTPFEEKNKRWCKR